MKRTLLTSLILLTALAAPLTTSAAPAGGEGAGGETWSGEGVVFDRKGHALGDYTLTLTRTPLAEGTWRHDVEVVLPGGKVKTERCTVKEEGESWRTTCEDGSRGGGHCLGDGMCIDYVQGEGAAFASTLVIDDARMRLLRTELRDGQAVRFYRETLLRRAK